MTTKICEYGCCYCCCTWGGSIGKRHGIESGEEPEFDCADCTMHGGQQDRFRCKSHDRKIGTSEKIY